MHRRGRVFAYVADFTRHGEWAGHGLEVTKSGDGAVAVGTTFSTTAKQFGTQREQSTITELTPDKTFAWDSTGALGRAHHWFSLSDEGDSTTLSKGAEMVDPIVPCEGHELEAVEGHPEGHPQRPREHQGAARSAASLTTSAVADPQDQQDLADREDDGQGDQRDERGQFLQSSTRWLDPRTWSTQRQPSSRAGPTTDNVDGSAASRGGAATGGTSPDGPGDCRRSWVARSSADGPRQEVAGSRTERSIL